MSFTESIGIKYSDYKEITLVSDLEEGEILVVKTLTEDVFIENIELFTSIPKATSGEIALGLYTSAEPERELVSMISKAMRTDTWVQSSGLSQYKLQFPALTAQVIAFTPFKPYSEDTDTILSGVSIEMNLSYSHEVSSE